MKAPQISDAALARGIREGQTYSSLARLHNVSRHVMRSRILRIPGVPPVGPGRPRADVDDLQILSLRADGLSLARVGALLGVSESLIRLRLKALGPRARGDAA
jgi:hypothetical protein